MCFKVLHIKDAVLKGPEKPTAPSAGAVSLGGTSGTNNTGEMADGQIGMKGRVNGAQGGELSLYIEKTWGHPHVPPFLSIS